MNATVRWTPDRTPKSSGPILPGYWTAVSRGIVNRCPVCGKTKLFQGYLTVEPECAVCGTELGRVRAEDAPPYFTIFLVGHLTIPALLIIWQRDVIGDTTLLAIALPTIAILTGLLLRPVKGGTVGLMLKLGMMRPAGE